MSACISSQKVLVLAQFSEVCECWLHFLNAQSIHLFFIHDVCFLFALEVIAASYYYKKMFTLTINDPLLSFSRSYLFSISLQFQLNIKSCNMFVNNVPAMQPKIVLDWGPVASVWNNLGVAGATILVILEKRTLHWRVFPRGPMTCWNA